MEKKYLTKFCEEKTRVRLYLKNGKFYTGIILELGDHTLVFRDKYNSEIPFDYESISYVDPLGWEKKDG